MLKTVITNENGCVGTRLASLSLCAAADSARETGRCFRFRPSKKGGLYLQYKKAVVPRKPSPRYHPCRFLYGVYVAVSAAPMLAQPVLAGAGGTIWTKASEIMKDVYSQVLAISTIAAVVTAAVALLLMNFSRSGRTVDESRAWIKRIIITWAILNSLGFIMSYVTPFFSGGQYTP